MTNPATPPSTRDTPDSGPDKKNRTAGAGVHGLAEEPVKVIRI